MFWTECLNRSFHEKFDKDPLDPHDPNKESWVPKNDASQFVVDVVHSVIDDQIDLKSCRYVMREVTAMLKAQASGSTDNPSQPEKRPEVA